MTKAYLSDRARRAMPVWNMYANEACEAELVELALDQEAEREARAILSDTEREERKSFGHAAFHVSILRLSIDLAEDGASEAVALANSLASFVAE